MKRYRDPGIREAYRTGAPFKRSRDGARMLNQRKLILERCLRAEYALAVQAIKGGAR